MCLPLVALPMAEFGILRTLGNKPVRFRAGFAKIPLVAWQVYYLVMGRSSGRRFFCTPERWKAGQVDWGLSPVT